MASKIAKSDEKQIIELEKKFWQSMVDRESKAATDLLHEPAVMVSAKGAMTFDHAGYRKMAEDDNYRLVEYKLNDLKVLFAGDDVAVLTYQVQQKTEMKGEEMDNLMSDSSTWVRQDGRWACVMHTEAPMAA